MNGDAQFYSNYWREMYETSGLTEVRSRIAAASGIGQSVGQEILKELEEKQEDDKHEDTVSVQMDANKISARANRISSQAVIILLIGAAISTIAACASVWVAFFKN